MLFSKQASSLFRFKHYFKESRSCLSYVQGQSPEPKIREYFYFIDHEGMLFLDDARLKNFTSCFKEKKFLKFFFDRIRLNQTDRYANEFPFISLCGRERNFIRCDDVPIVYTHVVPGTGTEGDRLAYGNAGDTLTTRLEPNKIYMSRSSGRVYHPATEQYGGIGLIRSKLAIEFSKYFQFAPDDESTGGDELPAPIMFRWNGQDFKLENEWVKNCQVQTKLFN